MSEKSNKTPLYLVCVSPQGTPSLRNENSQSPAKPNRHNIPPTSGSALESRSIIFFIIFFLLCCFQPQSIVRINGPFVNRTKFQFGLIQRSTLSKIWFFFLVYFSKYLRASIWKRCVFYLNVHTLHPFSQCWFKLFGTSQTVSRLNKQQQRLQRQKHLSLPFTTANDRREALALPAHWSKYTLSVWFGSWKMFRLIACVF